MKKEEVEKMQELYEKMVNVSIQTIDAIDQLSDSNIYTLGRLKYIPHARFKMQLNNIRMTLKSYLYDLSRDIKEY